MCEHRWNSRKLLVCSNWLEEWCGELATRDRDGGGGLLNSGELVCAIQCSTVAPFYRGRCAVHWGSYCARNRNDSSATTARRRLARGRRGSAAWRVASESRACVPVRVSGSGGQRSSCGAHARDDGSRKATDRRLNAGDRWSLTAARAACAASALQWRSGRGKGWIRRAASWRSSPC